MKKALALDLATSTGWAYYTGSRIYSGVWDLSIKKHEPNGFRLKRLWVRLEVARRIWGVEYLVYEQAGNLQGHAKRVLPALQGAVELWCCMQEVEYRNFAPTDIKKHATGKGTANKQDMLASARIRWPDLNVQIHDQADALWLLDLALKEFSHGEDQQD